MKEKDKKYILEGVLQTFPQRNGGRIYPYDYSKREIERMAYKLKIKKRKEKIKNILEDYDKEGN